MGAHRYEEIAELLGYPTERTAALARRVTTEAQRAQSSEEKKSGDRKEEVVVVDVSVDETGAGADPGSGAGADAARGFQVFADFVMGRDLRELEELYTSTFDIQGNVCLDVGYQLFGETYKRGQFIVKMRVALREAGVPENGELPDHLPNVLRFLAKREEEGSNHRGTESAEIGGEETNGGTAETVVGADAGAGRYPGDCEELVREAVLPAMVKMIEGFAAKPHPYRAVLEATKAILQADYGIAEIPAAPDVDRVSSFLPPGANGRFSLPVAQDYEVDEDGFEPRGNRP